MNIEFNYNNQKTIFSIKENHEFTNHEDEKFKYDYVYRIVDISGVLSSTLDKFNAYGYGFGTVVKMPVEQLPKLDLNIKKMVDNTINGVSLNEGLLIADNEMLDFHEGAIDFVTLVKIVNNTAYVMIFDSMPVYMNYDFLFSEIHTFKDENNQYIDNHIEDEEENFYFYYGDENTDGNFAEWLEEEAPNIYEEFKILKLIR